MDSISINTRLRPVRFGFLVRPDDSARLQTIFQINTCLWGGRYNPIIPYFQRVPSWWERNGVKFDSAKQIINGYLDFFEPDFIVEAEKGFAAEFGMDPSRVIQLSSVLARSDDRNERGHGLSVFDLYKAMYQDEFQFVQRNKHNIVDIRAKDRKFNGLVACLFGSFPVQKNLKYFASGFRDAFEPELIKLDAAALEKLLRKGFTSALKIGSAKLEIDFNDHRDPVIFVFDAFEPRDLLDFWNLRAIHRNLMAVPVQWLGELSSYFKDVIVKNYRPLPGNPHGVMIQATVMFSRSIPSKDIEPLFQRHLKVDREGANVLQTWYPPIWRPTPDYMVRTTRPTLECISKKFDIPIDVEKPEARFDTLYPDFANRFGNDHRWANVVRIEDWSYKGRIATAFPCDFRIPAAARFRTGGAQLLSTTEGLVTFPNFKGLPNHWELPDGTQAITQWLVDKGITPHLSESGRATQQIIQTLGGFWGVRALAQKDIIELLEEMSRRPITRSAHQREFQNKVRSAVGGDIWRNRVFETLVERKAVQLGYELRCSKCGSWSWYAIPQLKDAMTCDLCLREFDFPVAEPSNSKHARWAYRVIGPFALPEYAKGGYASALTVRFFAEVLGLSQSSEVTWTSGHELTMPNGKKAEADCILWYQRKHMFGTNHPTEIVFGEAKSFGKEAFKDRDVERMKSLATLFPGAVLVFATMKEANELSKQEILCIKRLAEWGREYDRNRRQTRAPVLMLTGTELFTAHHVQHTWKEKGGKHKELVEPGWIQLDNLRTLADITQQLYLGCRPMGHTWSSAGKRSSRE
jgi:hypothetical protein